VGSRGDHLHAAEQALERAWDEDKYMAPARQVWAAVASAEVALAAEMRVGGSPTRCTAVRVRKQCLLDEGHARVSAGLIRERDQVVVDGHLI
jgi:hypothetical protein